MLRFGEPLLAFIEWVARTFAAAPGAVVPVRLGSPAALVAAYAALAATRGTEARVAGRWVRAVGHCAFKPQHVGAAFDVLRGWLATGVHPGGGELAP